MVLVELEEEKGGAMMKETLHSVPAGGLTSGRWMRGAGVWIALCLCLVGQRGVLLAAEYFPPKESLGGWRKLTSDSDIRTLAGMDPVKLRELKLWLRGSDGRNFSAVVIRHGYIALEEIRNKSSVTDTGNIKSCGKAICATALAIASQRSQNKLEPKVMRFADKAFQFIPWASPLSDSRKSQIPVRQLLNHTSGITPESTGVLNDVSWDIVLGHQGSPLNKLLAFNPGTKFDYTTHAFYHAALVLENVTGQQYNQFTIDHLLKPLGIEKCWFGIRKGSIGNHADHGIGLPAREMARIAYCMLRGGKWKGAQVIPTWFVTETGSRTQSFNPEYTHGWELPGKVDSRIPSDARGKRGSGGQHIAFIPSKDLVIVRHTGGSGSWGTAGFPKKYYYDYLAKAIEAVVSSGVAPASRSVLTPTVDAWSSPID